MTPPADSPTAPKNDRHPRPAAEWRQTEPSCTPGQGRKHSMPPRSTAAAKEDKSFARIPRTTSDSTDRTNDADNEMRRKYGNSCRTTSAVISSAKGGDESRRPPSE